jgi:hypothetical protein
MLANAAVQTPRIFVEGCSPTSDKALVQPFLITTVESAVSHETQVNFTIVVMNLMRKIFGNLIDVESNCVLRSALYFILYVMQVAA